MWNPENPLIAGLWIGCLFDLILTQSSFIAMLFWPGFFVVSAARCCRSRENCAEKCCVCTRPVLPDDAENETVLVTDSSAFSKKDPKKKMSHQPSYTSLDGLGQRLVAMSAAGRRSQRSGVENSATPSSSPGPPARTERKTFVPGEEPAAGARELGDRDIERGASSASLSGFGLELVSHLRKYDAQSLLRLHKLADFKKLSGVLDYPRSGCRVGRSVCSRF